MERKKAEMEFARAYEAPMSHCQRQEQITSKKDPAAHREKDLTVQLERSREEERKLLDTILKTERLRKDTERRLDEQRMEAFRIDREKRETEIKWLKELQEKKDLEEKLQLALDEKRANEERLQREINHLRTQIEDTQDDSYCTIL